MKPCRAPLLPCSASWVLIRARLSAPGTAVGLASATMISLPPLTKDRPSGVWPTLTRAMSDREGSLSSLAAENATSALLSRSVTHTSVAVRGHDHAGGSAARRGR